MLIHNPLVSRLIHVSGDDPHSVQALFDDQEWIDNLLPLVHGLPGTEVNESGLIIRCTEKRVDLATLIQQALVVARGLRTHATRLQKESLMEASDANKRQRLPLNT